MSSYKRLEDFPITYQRQFGPAVWDMIKQWDYQQEGASVEDVQDWLNSDSEMDEWATEMSYDIAIRRLGDPNMDTPRGEDKWYRMLDWRTLVESETIRRLRERNK